MFSFYEFFAGGGMVRAGLGSGWRCHFANDIDGRKALTYQSNWGLGGEMHVGDISTINETQIDRSANLAWASFPCQDLSLAGLGRGFDGSRSSLFYEFWSKLELVGGRHGFPELVVVENVCGLLTANSGQDFAAVIEEFMKHGYHVGGVTVDASLFVPQSRPRLFVIGVRNDLDIDPAFVVSEPDALFHGHGLTRAVLRLEQSIRDHWIWYKVEKPHQRTLTLSDIVEDDECVSWFSGEKTASLLESMMPRHREKIAAVSRKQYSVYGSVFKRTRVVEGKRRVCAEVRFDGVAGCLRTPNGGSSRQILIRVDGADIHSRLLTPREAARLMGLEEDYRLPKNTNAALHLCGDGVVTSVVGHLRDQIFEPILKANACGSGEATCALAS